ncbi:MAG: hypothetical protein NXI20_08175 [bacterium]|nr:hypothetical protein [bacterium]
MKKLILSLTILGFISFSANAQIEQGAIFAGINSNLSFSSTNLNLDGSNDNLNSFNINVGGGYFLIDNFMVGLNAGYSSISQGDNDASSTLIGVFSRYYINGAPFIGVGFDNIKPDEADSYGQFIIQGGYAAFLTDNVSVEPAIQYLVETGASDRNTFAITVGFGIYLNRQ